MKIARWQLLLLPFLVTGFFMLCNVLYYGVNTPLWDEWNMVPLFEKADHHTLGFSDLWAQHNEHRILFPNIILLLAAYRTHWNIRAELLINFAFSAVTALMLYLLVLAKIKRRYAALTASVLIAAWFYSPIQYENWLLGWQLEWFMCVTGIVSSLYFLDRFSLSKQRRRLLLGAAIASAAVATYSLGGGLLVWPVGFGMLMLYRQGKRPAAAWLASAALAIAAYYYHYHRPAGSPPPALLLHQPLSFVKYVLGYIGSSVNNSDPQLAATIGLVLIALLVPLLHMVWIKRGRIEKFVPWLGLITFGLLSAAFTGAARLNLGTAQSTASRYAAFSLLFVIGLTGLTCALLDTLYIKRRLVAPVVLAAMAISAPLLLTSYAYGARGLAGQSARLHQAQACTRRPDPGRACLLLTAPYPDRNTQRTGAWLSYIKTKHWGGY